MRNIDVLIAWLDGLPHRTRKGHWPNWMELGAGRRQCVNCLKGGHRPPRRRLVLYPNLLPSPQPW